MHQENQEKEKLLKHKISHGFDNIMLVTINCVDFAKVT
jgi:hypothetical protein